MKNTLNIIGMMLLTVFVVILGLSLPDSFGVIAQFWFILDLIFGFLTFWMLLKS